MQALPKTRMAHQYRCRNCGAPSYGPVIARDAAGAMTSTGQYRCTGCSMRFQDLAEWRSAPVPDSAADRRNSAATRLASAR